MARLENFLLDQMHDWFPFSPLECIDIVRRIYKVVSFEEEKGST